MKFPNLPEIFYDYFTKTNGEREPQEQITFGPSYLTSCLRQIYYKKTGEKPSNPITGPGYFKMHFGTVQHTELQRILSELGYLVSAEEHKTVVYEGLTFNYLYDGILKFEGEEFLMEIKTVYARGFDFIKTEPKEDHLMQAISYMVFENIPRCVIFYVGRDNGYAIQHIVALIENKVYVNGLLTDLWIKWQENIDRMKSLREAFDAKVLPNRDFQIVMKNTGSDISFAFQKDNVKHKSDWQCSYCSFRDTCYSQELKDIKKHKYYINGKFS